MFVTTANSLNMPQPLMDRMEIIRVSGYTEDEKVEIAKRHVLPKVTTDNGLTPAEFVVPDETIRDLIRYYTREAGVRSLERALGGLARKAVREMVQENTLSITIDDEGKLAKYAGVQKFRYGETDEEDQVGIVTGLAWTEFGGEILTIEAIKMPGRGRMTITGNLKDVMKESISAPPPRPGPPLTSVKPPVRRRHHVPPAAPPRTVRPPPSGHARPTGVHRKPHPPRPPPQTPPPTPSPNTNPRRPHPPKISSPAATPHPRPLLPPAATPPPPRPPPPPPTTPTPPPPGRAFQPTPQPQGGDNPPPHHSTPYTQARPPPPPAPPRATPSPKNPHPRNPPPPPPP